MQLLLLVAALPAFALACGENYDTWLDGRCFRMNFYSNVNYNYVSGYCKDDGARLPVISSEEETDQFFSALKNFNAFSSFSFWLGLTCDGTDFVWSDGTVVNYTNSADNYTCSPSSTDRRYYIDSDRLWYESNGSPWGVNNVVCEAKERSSSPCDSFDLLEAGKSADVCYKLATQPVTWQSAENNCVHQGAHLAVVHDQTLNDYLRRTAVAYTLLDGIHIGMRTDDVGNFSWVDGSAMNYDNYVPGFPNAAYGDCVAMETGFLPGQWMNIPCYGTQLPYVCTKSPFVAANPQPAGCPKNQYAPGEEIYSPSYPQAPGAGGCDYVLLQPDANKRAEVEISFFESNSCCDTLTIYDGLFGSNVLKTMRGYYGGSPVTIRANSNAMRLQWSASSGSHVRGFRAKMNVT